MATAEMTYVPAVDYHRDYSRVSNSMLKVFSTSPHVYNCYYVARTHEPPAPTPAMQRGTMLHSCVFEPGFIDRLCVAPKCDKRTNVGKSAYAEFLAESAGKTIVDADDYAEIHGMYRRLRDHRLASALLWGDGPTEQVFIGECGETGLPLKGRLDKLLEDKGIVVDLKTCQDPSEQAFARQAVSFGYFQQAYFYSELVRQQTGHTLDFVFVCVTPTQPVRVGIWPVRPRGLDFGRAKASSALTALKECYETGDWRDKEEKESALAGGLEPPAWAERALEFENT